MGKTRKGQLLPVAHAHGTAVPHIHPDLRDTVPVEDGSGVEMERGRRPVQGWPSPFSLAPHETRDVSPDVKASDSSYSADTALLRQDLSSTLKVIRSPFGPG